MRSTTTITWWQSKIINVLVLIWLLVNIRKQKHEHSRLEKQVDWGLLTLLLRCGEQKT